MRNRSAGSYPQLPGKRSVCGGTTSKIVARELGQRIDVELKYYDEEVPPTAHIEGIDLVTEGILTLSAAEKRMKEYLDEYEDNVRKKEILDLIKRTERRSWSVCWWRRMPRMWSL